MSFKFAKVLIKYTPQLQMCRLRSGVNGWGERGLCVMLCSIIG